MNGHPINSDDRITALEISLAHQQRLCEQLNEVITDHTRQIMQLEKRLREQSVELEGLRENRKQDRLSPADERPPHY